MTAASLSNHARIWWLVGLGSFAVGMMLFFLFGFSAFYGLWCKITGTELNPNNAVSAAAVAPDDQRELTVFFEAKTYDNLPVRFYPDEPKVVVKVGEDRLTKYRFKNLSDQPVHFRPVHMVSPNIAAKNFVMKVCFCFNDQTIAAGETVEYPVMFRFNPEIDERVQTVMIRYSLHHIEDGEERSATQERLKEQIEAAGTIVTPGLEGQIEGKPSSSTKTEASP